MAKKKVTKEDVKKEVAEATKTVTELIDEKDAEIKELKKTCLDLNEENTLLAQGNSVLAKKYDALSDRYQKLAVEESGNARIAVLEAEIRDYEKTLQGVRVELGKAQDRIKQLEGVI